MIFRPSHANRGMAMASARQRLNTAWIGDPQVMLLDEPSNGLDNHAREILAQRIRLRGLEGLALFASHDAAFVEACGANILRMDHLESSLHCPVLEVDSRGSPGIMPLISAQLQETPSCHAHNVSLP